MDKDNLLMKVFENITKKLITGEFIATDFKYIDYGFQFTVSNAENRGVIRIFVNKKNKIKYDFSQIKDNSLKGKLSNLLKNEVPYIESKVDNASEKKNELIEYQPAIGTDESGKGDYFGPLVAAGVYVDENDKLTLENEGVKDSKKINDQKILILANIIKEVCVNKYSVIEISPEKYNSLYKTFKDEKKNLNNLLGWAHAKAIEEILNKVDCQVVISDKFANDKVIIDKLQERGKKVHLIQEHKAENNISVAAASILARARFLEKLNKLSLQYKIDFKKGASDEVIQQAKIYSELYGKENLVKVAKLHFKTTKSI